MGHVGDYSLCMPFFRELHRGGDMRLKSDFEFVNLGDEIIAVPIGKGAEQIRGVLKMNPEGMEIVDLLKRGNTEEQIVDTLTAKYENDRDTISGYVHVVLSKLWSAGLMEEERGK